MFPRRVAIACYEPAAKEQSILTLERDAVLDHGHTRPGQYCKLSLSVPLVDGYFSLIDPPGSGPFRFLLRAGGSVASALGDNPVGTDVTVEGPSGLGFPIERTLGRDLLLVSAGTGIAAVRPVLIEIKSLKGRRVWLYHGARTIAHVPFITDLKRAQASGVSVTLCASREKTTESIAGRVQHAIERDKPDLHNAVAFVSGMSEMVDALRSVLPKLGLDSGSIFLNH